MAERLAIPHRHAIFCPSVLNDRDAQNWNALFGPPINSHRASIDLPPVDDVGEFMFTDRPWLAADPTLGPWPESAGLDVVHTGAWILLDGRPLPADLVAFLGAGAPPVYVGRRALLAHGWAGLALVDDRDDWDDCFAVGEVNQQAVFGRVAELGIGGADDGPTPTTESLSAALRTSLTPETGARAQAVAGTIRADGTTVAAELLLDPIRPEGNLPCPRRSRLASTGLVPSE